VNFAIFVIRYLNFKIDEKLSLRAFVELESSYD